MIEETSLPEVLRARASVTAGGEYAWRQEDIASVIAAAQIIGLATLGGQVQFHFSDGTCEPYWLEYVPAPRQADEDWPTYVTRSAHETLAAFNRLCATVNFADEAMQWEFIRQKVQVEGIDPLTYLWFVLYFDAGPPSSVAA